jgi:hypothetical protein
MFYAGLRPQKAISLRANDVVLPPQALNEDRESLQHAVDDDDWGELHLHGATPDTGSDRTDDGTSRERRSSSTAPKVTAGSCRLTQN